MLALAVSDLCQVVYEYLNLAFLLDWNAVYLGAPRLRADAPRLLRVIAAMGEIDAAVSIASFRAGSKGWTRPRFCRPGAPISMTGIRHPLILDAVANSIQMGPPHGVLVTGSNMSGKSTFLRTVGVSAVLAQTINTCLATDYEAPVFCVRSCIGRADDLLAGKSYYLVEVEALLELVRASGDRIPHLFLLDELFRGTNAVERIAAGEAVLRELIVDGRDFKPHIVLAATHDGELVDLLRDRYAAYHFGDAIGPNGLTFDYHLLPGPATTRNAITLLQLQGAPESLVNRALARAAALDHERRAISSEPRET
jgi:DNA mismatch repair ATPase MutS